MKSFMHDCAIILACLLAVALAVEAAQAAPVTVRVPMPTAYSDGAPLPAASRIGAKVYCGPSAGRYVQAWGEVSTADAVDVTIDVRSRVFCANTAVAKASDGSGDVESDFGVEYTMTPNQPSVPLNHSSVRPAVPMCSTVCSVDRRR